MGRQAGPCSDNTGLPGGLDPALASLTSAAVTAAAGSEAAGRSSESVCLGTDTKSPLRLLEPLIASCASPGCAWAAPVHSASMHSSNECDGSAAARGVERRAGSDREGDRACVEPACCALSVLTGPGPGRADVAWSQAGTACCVETPGTSATGW